MRILLTLSLPLLIASAVFAQTSPDESATVQPPSPPAASSIQGSAQTVRDGSGSGNGLAVSSPSSFPALDPPPLVFSRGVEVQPLESEPIHTEDVMKVRDRLPSGKDRVAVDIFSPPDHARHPAVILLHGTHGPGRAEKYYLRLAEDLARHGYISLFVRYYDRGRKGRGNRAIWARTIGDTLTFAAGLPDVDPDRMALLGYSQGAFLALNDAPSDPRIRAVVAFYGGLSPGFFPAAEENMPPTLLFHGTADRIVPVRRSLQTLELLRRAGRPADLVVYPGAGHGFNLNSRQGANAVAAKDSWARTLTFLDFHLRYPAWTPAVEPLTDKAATAAAEATDNRPSAATGSPFSQPPLTVVPYLAMPPQAPEGESVILINPSFDEVKKYLPVHSSRKKGRRARRAKPAPKAVPPAPKAEEIMP
jgi:carboxymethylenebutenolidase